MELENKKTNESGTARPRWNGSGRGEERRLFWRDLSNDAVNDATRCTRKRLIQGWGVDTFFQAWTCDCERV